MAESIQAAAVAMPAVSTGETLLDISGLRAGYGESKVLHGIDLAVGFPRVVGLLGRNGAGKTTLLQTVTGFLKPTTGRVTFAGRDVTGAKPESLARQGIGYVPQDRSIFRSLTVRENLAIGAGIRSGSTVTIDDVVGLFPRLGERFGQRAGTLSGGERKMLAVARALLSDPTLLILDEPTEGVWPTVIAELADRLATLSRTRSILIVEQHVGIVLDLAQHIYVLDRGTVALHGTPDDVTEGDRLYRYLAP